MKNLYISNSILSKEITDFSSFYESVKLNGMTNSLYTFGTVSPWNNLNINLTPYVTTEGFIDATIDFLSSIINAVVTKIIQLLHMLYGTIRGAVVSLNLVEKKVEKLRTRIRSSNKNINYILSYLKATNNLTLYSFNDFVNLTYCYKNIITIIDDITIVKQSDSIFKYLQSNSIIANLDPMVDKTVKNNFEHFKNKYVKLKLYSSDDAYIFDTEITVNKMVNTNIIDLGYVGNDINQSLKNLQDTIGSFSNINNNILKKHKDLDLIKNKLEKIRISKDANEQFTPESTEKINIWFQNLTNFMSFLIKITSDVSGFLTDLNYTVDLIDESIQ